MPRSEAVRVLALPSWDRSGDVKIHVDVEGGRRAAREPHESADHVVVDGACPVCGHVADGAFSCIGQASEQVTTHDTIAAPALARCCGAVVGKLIVKMNTIFGIEEDRAVLRGRCRVY